MEGEAYFIIDIDCDQFSEEHHFPSGGRYNCKTEEEAVEECVKEIMRVNLNEEYPHRHIPKMPITCQLNVMKRQPLNPNQAPDTPCLYRPSGYYSVVINWPVIVKHTGTCDK